MHCKDCVFRVVNKVGEKVCKNLHLFEAGDKEEEIDKEDSLQYSYNEGGWFEVGDNFGCVHFQDRNEVLKLYPNWKFNQEK